MCDGQPDCPLGEDERACLQSTCKGTAVKCMGGECIPPQWMCDGEVDCKDLSDESNRTCGMPIISNSSIEPQYSGLNSRAYLTNASCLTWVYRVVDALEKLGEREKH